MVLISLDPFASRKILLIIAAVLGFSALCFADPVLMAQRYDTSGAKANSGETNFGQSRFLEFNGFGRVPLIKAIDLRSRGQELLSADGHVGEALSSATVPEPRSSMNA